MSQCSAAAFDTLVEARSMRRQCRRAWHIPINVRQCEICDKYHFTTNLERLHVPQPALTVLNLTAQGYNTTEIAHDTGMNLATVRWYLEELRAAFSALSSPHMVAIAIYFGAINPADFVPPIVKRDHGYDQPVDQNR